MISKYLIDLLVFQKMVQVTVNMCTENSPKSKEARNEILALVIRGVASLQSMGGMVNIF